MTCEQGHNWHPEIMDSLPPIRLCLTCGESLRVGGDYDTALEWRDGEWRTPREAQP